MKTFAIRIVVMLVALSVGLAPIAGAAEKDDDLATNAGIGVASVVCSIPYGVLKVAGAVVGGVVGGFTYLLSGFDKRAADSVWYTTMGGDYIVTPDNLRGKKDLRVTGVPPDSSRNGR